MISAENKKDVYLILSNHMTVYNNSISMFSSKIRRNKVIKQKYEDLCMHQANPWFLQENYNLHSSHH
jgi:hypothetical protein